MASASKQQQAVDDWNAKHPPGTQVNVRMDNGSTRETKTRSEAWLLGGHTAVILMEGISGGYSLDRVTAV